MGKKSRLKKERWAGAQKPSKANPAVPAHLAAADAILVEAFKCDDAAKMDEMERLALRAGGSWTDFYMNVVDYSDNSTQQCNLPLAAFLLEKPRIFHWLASRMRSDVLHGFEDLHPLLDGDGAESAAAYPHRRGMVRDYLYYGFQMVLLDSDWEKFVLEVEKNQVHGRFADSIFKEFQAELLAASEKDDLQTLVSMGAANAGTGGAVRL